ncbi:protein enabled homolog [Osmerus eperlanus]|uniref:protein enabled homolog n=1 Tax=Osmerus eperlanus TaxID=29151 RepID=UPI002E0E5E3F
MQGQQALPPPQIPPQPALRSSHPIPLDTIQPLLSRDIVNSREGYPQPVAPRAPCGLGQGCWSPDAKLVVLLLSLAGAVILLLLYRLLQLRHRLKLARTRDALEYYSFCHAATYTFKNPDLPQELPVNGATRQAREPPSVEPPSVEPPSGEPPPKLVIHAPVTPLPPPPASPPPTLPPPPHRVLPPPPILPPPPLPPTPPLVALPFPLPIIHTTPPSPHLSWGAGSDAEVYSRIGAFRPSRLSSLSQTQVILFEHSAL